MLRGGEGTSRAPAMVQWVAVVWGGEHLPAFGGEHLSLMTAVPPAASWVWVPQHVCCSLAGSGLRGVTGTTWGPDHLTTCLSKPWRSSSVPFPAPFEQAQLFFQWWGCDTYTLPDLNSDRSESWSFPVGVTVFWELLCKSHVGYSCTKLHCCCLGSS